MTCPHCGFLMSPLDGDCARCRHRGYVPPMPTDAYTPSHTPISPSFSQLSSSSRLLEVVTGLIGTTALVGVMLFGVMLSARRDAQGRAEIASLRLQLNAERQARLRAEAMTMPPATVFVPRWVEPPVTGLVGRAIPTARPSNVPHMPYNDPFRLIFCGPKLTKEQIQANKRWRQQEREREVEADRQWRRNFIRSIHIRTTHSSNPVDPFNPTGRF